MHDKLLDRYASVRMPLRPGELAHYGVKGMRWGVRKKTSSSPAHGDARKKQRVVSRARSNRSTDSISNADLRRAIERMNLERQYEQLRPRSTLEKTKKWIADTLLGVGKEQAASLARDFAKEQVKNAAKNKS